MNPQEEEMNPQEEEISLQEEKINLKEEKVNLQEENELCNQECHIFKNSKSLDKLAPKIMPAIISGSLFWLFAAPMSTLKKGSFWEITPWLELINEIVKEAGNI